MDKAELKRIAVFLAAAAVFLIIAGSCFAYGEDGVSEGETSEDPTAGYFVMRKGRCGKNVTYKIYGEKSEDTASDREVLVVISGTGPMYNYSDNKKINWGEAKELIIEKGVTTVGSHLFIEDNDNYLRKVTLPEGTLKIGSYAFYNCVKLKAVKLPKTLKTIGAYAFGFTGLRSISIPDSVTSIKAEAFCYCEKMTSVKFGKGLKTIGKYAFSSCVRLKKAILPDSVTGMGRAVFSNCSRLKKVRVSASLTKLPVDAFIDCSKLTKVTFPSKSKLKEIGGGAFMLCSSLKSITFPKKVKTFRKGAFDLNRRLRVVKLLGRKYPVFRGSVVFGDRNKKITIKCPNMKRATKKKFRAYLKKKNYKGKIR